MRVFSSAHVIIDACLAWQGHKDNPIKNPTDKNEDIAKMGKENFINAKVTFPYKDIQILRIDLINPGKVPVSAEARASFWPFEDPI